MSQAISKRPSWVVNAGLEMLEYVAGTTGYCLVYSPCGGRMVMKEPSGDQCHSWRSTRMLLSRRVVAVAALES